MRKLFFIFSLLLIALFTSCNKENKEPIIDPTAAKILVLNEGGYTKGNSTLSAIDFDGVTKDKVFETANNKPIGDVGQSILYSGGKYYIAVSNSKKVQVISATDYKLITTISIEGQNPAPQYMAEISADIVVLSDLNENVLHIINTKTNTVTGKITLPANGSKMIVIDRKLFVNIGNGIVVIDTDNLTSPTRTINVISLKSAQFVLDKNNNFWAISTDGLIKVDPASESVSTIALPKDLLLNIWGARLTIDAAREKLYFNGQSKDEKPKPMIYQMSIEETTPKLLFTIENVQALYNMEISPDNKIMVCDALDYVQKGYLFSYNLDGTKEKEYQVGIIPQFILFTEYNKN